MKPHGATELYDFENEILHATMWHEQEQSFDMLYTLLWGMWVSEYGDLDNCPKLSKKPHPKVTSNGETTTFYNADTHTIHMLEGQRTLIMLVHETTHAMGFHDHGFRFRRRYFYMLTKNLTKRRNAQLRIK